MPAHVLFITTSHPKLGNTEAKTGYHLAEVSRVYNRLQEANIFVDFASVLGGHPPMDPQSHDLEDKDNKHFTQDNAAQTTIQQSMSINHVDPEKYQALYFPGGHGTMWDLPNNPDLAKLIVAHYEAGGILAAVCHGPAAFVGVTLPQGEYLVAGKQLTCFSDEEERLVKKDHIVPFLLESQLRQQGAKMHIGKPWSDCVSVDERIITGQNPASANSLAKALIEKLSEMK